MERAGSAALDALGELFAEMRKRDGVNDKRRGHLYRKGAPWRISTRTRPGFTPISTTARIGGALRVSTQTERRRFLATLDRVLHGD